MMVIFQCLVGEYGVLVVFCAIWRYYRVEVRLMGVVSTDSESGSSESPTMRRKLVIWTQRHRRPLTVVVYVLLLSVLAVVAFVPSYLDAVLAPLVGGGSLVDSGVVQPVDVVAARPSPTAVVRKVFDLPFVPQRDFLCDEMHLKVCKGSFTSDALRCGAVLRNFAKSFRLLI